MHKVCITHRIPSALEGETKGGSRLENNSRRSSHKNNSESKQNNSESKQNNNNRGLRYVEETRTRMGTVPKKA